MGTTGRGKIYQTISELTADIFDVHGATPLGVICETGREILVLGWKYNGVKETNDEIKFNFRCGSIHHRKTKNCPKNRVLSFQSAEYFKPSNYCQRIRWVVTEAEGMLI